VRQATEAINEAGAHLALVERQARALGAGQLDHPALEEASPGELGASVQNAVRTLAASLTEREDFRRRLAHEAAHDPLTQIPNRKACLTELQRGLARTGRNHSTLALMFLDLDGFKEINDRLGHQAGDIVLETTAQRLVSAVREGDHVGRLGGDEFIVIAEPVDGVAEAMELAERLLDTVSEPIQVGGTRVSVDACIGVALAHETDLTADELLHDADLAVYKAKTLGRGRVELCDDELRVQMTRQAEHERALSEAIRNDELTVHYQPTVDPHTGAILALEALARWQRPGHGLLLPVDFIPLAERSNLIVEIDRWVVEEVAGQLETWQTEDNALASVPIAVNVAARHLGADTLVADILQPLHDHHVDPARLIIEVTERALFSDLTDVAPKLHELRSNGVKVAIDDFGTGYTSLAHLRTLPVDILKIDHCFTSDGTAGALVKLIIDTGHLLGAEITAEGVETSEQAEFLTRLGSDGLQGFLFGRPCPPDELRAQVLGLARA
jgi:diguanylate cyclase (GGDEF)-like protein